MCDNNFSDSISELTVSSDEHFDHLQLNSDVNENSMVPLSSPKSNIASVIVNDSSDVHFGNQTIFNQPVTISQFIADSQIENRKLENYKNDVKKKNWKILISLTTCVVLICCVLFIIFNNNNNDVKDFQETTTKLSKFIKDVTTEKATITTSTTENTRLITLPSIVTIDLIQNYVNFEKRIKCQKVFGGPC